MSFGPEKILGVDAKFSSLPLTKKHQAVDAVIMGFSLMTGRFGRLRAKNWAPTDRTTVFCETPEQFVETVIKSEPGLGENDLELLSMGHAHSDTDNMVTVFNLSRISTPSELVYTAAHETVRQWSDGRQIAMPETKLAAMSKGGPMHAAAIEELEVEANAAILNYVVYEGVKLIDTGVDFGEKFGGQFLGREASMIRQLLLHWQDSRADKAFQMTQGTLLPEQVEELNRRMGSHPENPDLKNYFEQGLLLNAAVMHFEHNHGNGAAAARAYRQGLIWLQAGLGNFPETRDLTYRDRTGWSVIS